MNGMMQLQTLVMGASNRILQIQSSHKEYLENLAIDLVKKETGITDQVNFEADLVNPGEISKQGMSSKPEEYDEDEIEKQFGGEEDEEEEDEEEEEDDEDEEEEEEDVFLVISQGSTGLRLGGDWIPTWGPISSLATATVQSSSDAAGGEHPASPILVPLLGWKGCTMISWR